MLTGDAGRSQLDGLPKHAWPEKETMFGCCAQIAECRRMSSDANGWVLTAAECL